MADAAVAIIRTFIETGSRNLHALLIQTIQMELRAAPLELLAFVRTKPGNDFASIVHALRMFIAIDIPGTGIGTGAGNGYALDFHASEPPALEVRLFIAFEHVVTSIRPGTGNLNAGASLALRMAHAIGIVQTLVRTHAINVRTCLLDAGKVRMNATTEIKITLVYADTGTQRAGIRGAFGVGRAVDGRTATVRSGSGDKGACIQYAFHMRCGTATEHGVTSGCSGPRNRRAAQSNALQVRRNGA